MALLLLRERATKGDEFGEKLFDIAAAGIIGTNQFLETREIIGSGLVEANEFVELTAFRFGGLSSNVVNKATWEKKDLSAFIGSEWIHVAYVLNVVPEFASYVCNDSLKFEKPSLKRKRWDSGGAQFFRTGLKVVRVYRTMDPCVYSRAMRRRAVRGIRGGYLTAIPRAKALGLKVDGELLRELFGLYRNWPGFWFVDLPLLAVPNAVYRALLRAYRWGRA